MVALPEVKTVEEAELKQSTGFLVSDGLHEAVLVKSEFVDGFKQGSPRDLLFTGVITKGDYQHTEFEIRCGILNHEPIQASNPTFTWSVAGFGMLASISKALGMTSTPKDSSELHNKPLMIKTETKAGKDWVNNQGETVKGKDKSIIKKCEALSSVATPTPQTATTTTQADAEQPKEATANPFAPPA